MLDNIILLPNYWVSRYKSIYSIVGPFSLFFFFFFSFIVWPHPTPQGTSHAYGPL